MIEVLNLSKRYRTGEVDTVALNHATLSLAKGEIGVILGPSGSGKSTLMNIVGGIDRADEGKVTIGGTDLMSLTDQQLTAYRRAQIGFIFQSYNLMPHLTVAENIEVIEQISANPLPIDEVLEAIGMSEQKHRFPRELSGGQQQRVAIARAVVKRPALLLCDELTGALDYESAIRVLQLIQMIHRRYGTTVLIITHNAAIAAMAHRVYTMRSGAVTQMQINPQPVEAEAIEW